MTGVFTSFGGRVPVPRAVWNSVPYSSDKAGDSLQNEISKLGTCGRLPPLLDVDTMQDLNRLTEKWRTAGDERAEELQSILS